MNSKRDALRRMPGERSWQLEGGAGKLVGFRREGAGRRMGVFIHGFRSHCDGDKSRYLSQMAEARGYGWLRFDQRGCGLSDGDFRRFTLSGAIADLHCVLAALDGAACILVGSSLGALIAIHAAASGRHRVDGLVLLAPALRFSERFVHGHLDARDLDCWRARGYRWFPDLYAGGCYRLDYAFLADALAYGEPPMELPCPVRIIHGARDELLPPGDSGEWAGRLKCPSHTLEIIAEGDHRLTGWNDVIARHTETLWKEVADSCA